MKLISCGNCGVVLDAEKVKFPSEDSIYDDNFVLRPELAGWTGDCHVPVAPCPVCSEKIDNTGEWRP